MLSKTTWLTTVDHQLPGNLTAGNPVPEFEDKKLRQHLNWNHIDEMAEKMAYLHPVSTGSEVKWSEVAQLCPTLCNPMDCSPPGSSVHGILQARILEWVVITFSRGSSRPRDRTQVSRIRGRCFNLWATREASKPFPGTELGFNPSFSIFEDLSVKVWNLTPWWWCFRSHWEQEHRTSWDFFSQQNYL